MMITAIQFRRGSLSLEAALIIPLVLVIGVCLLSCLQCIEAEIKVKGALDRTAAEISLLSPTVYVAEKMGMSLDLPDLSSGDTAGRALEILNQVLAELVPGETIDSIAKDLFLDLASSATLGPILQKRMDYWLAEACSGQPGWQMRLGERRLFLDWQYNSRRLWLCLSYDLRTPFGLVRRQANAIVPLWTGQQDFQASPNDDIWMLDNFSRGQSFRKIFGANLPDSFPVIALFSSGEAVMIKSVDLTAPTYHSQAGLRSCLTRMVDDLADFKGASFAGSEGKIEISANAIKSRKLILIVPENADQPWLPDLLHELQAYAGSCEVTFQFSEYGSSYRYERASQDQLVSSAGLRYHFNVAVQWQTRGCWI